MILKKIVKFHYILPYKCGPCRFMSNASENVKSDLPKESLITLFELNSEKFNVAISEYAKSIFYYAQNSEIYGGLKGVYDYGPLGFEIKKNLIQKWRDIFMLQENMIEIESSIIGSKEMFDASGHVKNFNDAYMKDIKTGSIKRIDSVLKNLIDDELLSHKESDNRRNLLKLKEKIPTMSSNEIMDRIKELDTSQSDSKSKEMSIENLMLQTNFIHGSGYLRPEIAQGIFINFHNIARIVKRKLPFGICQTGPAFRNEISLDNKIYRSREFTLAEVEYFYDGNETKNTRISDVEDVEVRLLTSESQIKKYQDNISLDQNDHYTITSIGKAVENNIISDHTGYIMGLGQRFFSQIGLSFSKIRWRQQLPQELAHYSNDCWDIEAPSSIGWVEIAGLASRTDYDLIQHFKQKSKSDSRANDKNVGGFPNLYNNDNSSEKSASKTSYYPYVMELSIGINRVFQVLLEQNLKVRKHDTMNYVLSLPICVAPYKVSINPLKHNESSTHTTMFQIASALKSMGIRVQYADNSIDLSLGGNIGKRYAISDFSGIPYAVTVDDVLHLNDDGKEEPTYKIRERDSRKQLRIRVSDTKEVFTKLILLEEPFETIVQKYDIS